ncbi:MAG: class I SAM-dependent methyltransferase [Salinigranum sp.]
MTHNGSHHDHGYETGEEAAALEAADRYRYLSAEEVYDLLDPDPAWTVADLGSGTGFYADDVAEWVETLYAVDVHEAMQDAYREKGVPDNVAQVTSDVADMPLDDDELDAAVSLRTFDHGVAESLGEVARVLRPGGRFVVVDWSATGAGDRDRGPDPEDCFDLAAVQSLLLEVGFRIRAASERRETFVVVATLRRA